MPLPRPLLLNKQRGTAAPHWPPPSCVGIMCVPLMCDLVLHRSVFGSCFSVLLVHAVFICGGLLCHGSLETLFSTSPLTHNNAQLCPYVSFSLRFTLTCRCEDGRQSHTLRRERKSHAATLDGLFHLLGEGRSIAALKGVFSAFQPLADAAAPCVTSSGALHPGDHTGCLTDGVTSLHLVEVSHRLTSTFRLLKTDNVFLFEHFTDSKVSVVSFKECKPTCITEFPCVATFAVTVCVTSVRDLAAAVFAGETAAGVEQLSLVT
ncbi:hypothetical protein GOODEAATRI_001087 [Goodea atripinnis]|uniref:Uncharacterized protein n=1 Tax=Goodea atripinnis TaxID=208336 RepID=A0ABV0PJS6_9TELE